MKTLSEILAQITGPDEAARAACLAQWDGLAKPLGSLGLLEDSLARIAAVTGSPDITLDHRTLLVLCADNGVVAQGVTQCGSSVTASVARALAAGESTVCHMARCARCRVVPVDMGMADFSPTPGVWDRRVRNGTADITQGPAMTRTECVHAIELGAELVRKCRESGASIIATGEMGIGNTTTSSALASVLLDKSPWEVTGRGAGLSDAGLARKIAAIERAVALNRPDPSDPVDVISKVGGLDIAGLCGVAVRCPAAARSGVRHASQPRFRRTSGRADAGGPGSQPPDLRRNAPGRGQRGRGGPAPAGHGPGSLSQRTDLRTSGH